MIEFTKEMFNYGQAEYSYSGGWMYKFFLHKIINDPDTVSLIGEFHIYAHLDNGEGDTIPYIDDIKEELGLELTDEEYEKLRDDVFYICSCAKLEVKAIYDREKLVKLYNEKDIYIKKALIKEEALTDCETWFDNINTVDESIGELNDNFLYSELKDWPKDLVDYICKWCNDEYDDIPYGFGDEWGTWFTQPLEPTIYFKF